MDLNGMITGGGINEVSRASASGGNRAPTPNPKDRSGAFDDVVAKTRPQRNANSGIDEPPVASGRQTDPEAETPSGHNFDAVNPRDSTSDTHRVTPDNTGSSHDDASGLPDQLVLIGKSNIARMSVSPDDNLQTIATASPTPVLIEQPARPAPAQPAGTSAPGAPGIVFAATANAPTAAAATLLLGEGSPGKYANPAIELTRLGVEGEVMAPRAYSGSSAAQPADINADRLIQPNIASKTGAMPERQLQRLAASAPTLEGGRVSASDTTAPQPLPQILPKTSQIPANNRPDPAQPSERSVQRLAVALPVWETAMVAGGPPIEDSPELKPSLPELASVALRSRGPVASEPVMQTLGASERASTAAVPATPAQSPAGPTPGPGAPAWGPDVARSVAPQIAIAIGSNPGSGRIELRLDPPELGNVGILIEVTDQTLRAILMAERPATNEMMRRHSEILLAQLQQAGFSNVDLQFAGNRAGDQGNAPPGDAPQSPFADSDRERRDEGTADVPAHQVVRSTADGLDLRL